MTSMKSNYNLVATNIHKSYEDGRKKLQVLRGVNINCNESEIILIKGPSGSGKTTLLNILSSLDKPDNKDSSIYIRGEKVDYLNTKQINYIRSNQVGILFQSHFLLEELTVLENLSIPFTLNDIQNNHNPLELLKKINLESKINNYPKELSGGECQRIALLRAIINKPNIVFADEPTGNLDEDNVINMIKLISNLKDKYRLSFIIATHDNRLCDIADKIFYLNDGILK